MSIVALGLQRLWGKRDDSIQPAQPEATEAPATTGGSMPMEPVVVWRAANPMEAQIVKGRLHSVGIPANVRGEAMGRICGFIYGGLAERDVLVPGLLAEKAQAILSEEVQWELDGADEG